MAEEPVRVDDADSFIRSLEDLKGKAHGDVLAVYLGLRFHRKEFPPLASKGPGLPSGTIEELLDDFYVKEHGELGENSGKVCHIPSDSWTPRPSYPQNNWRDVFRSANGVGCLAPAA